MKNILENIARKNGGIITTNDAAVGAVSRATLCALCNDGVINRIAHGQYVLSGELQDDIFSLSRRSEYLIFSHETALYLHGLSNRTPLQHSITTPSNHKPSVALRSECSVFYIKEELFELGRTLVNTPFGNKVPCYDVERTICDIVRSRNKIEQETLLNAIKLYGAFQHRDLNKLARYSRCLHVEKIIRPYLEIAL